MVPTTEPAAVLHLATWLPSELHEEFSAWCDDHHRGQLTLPGFRRARRFERISVAHEDDPPQFLTMYDLDSLDALDSTEYRQHAEKSGGLPEFLRNSIRVRRRDCVVLAALPNPWWPPSPTPLLDVFQLNDDRLGVGLRDHIDRFTPPIDPGFTLRIIDSEDDAPIVLVDHDDSTVDLIDTITAASGSMRSTWRCCFDEQP